MRQYICTAGIALCIAVGFAMVSCAKSDDIGEWANGEQIQSGGNGTMDGNGGSANDGDTPTFDSTIADYDGSLATDAANDVIGSDEDTYWETNEFTKTVNVVYDGNTATVTSTSGDVVSHVSGAHVTIDLLTNSVKGVEIIASGASPDGQLKIYGEKKLKLTLNGLDIACASGPAINNQCKKRIFVYLPNGTTNKLADAASYGDDAFYIDETTKSSEDRKGCFFSEGNIIVSGAGSLIVDGQRKHAMATDGYFYMRPGATLALTATGKDCLHVKGDTDDNIGVRITGGLLYANTSATAGKGINCSLNVEISGGTLQLNTSGGSEYDSDEKDTSSPSCIKADGNISVNGGSLTLKSTGMGGKGMKADGTIAISSGTTTIATTGGRYVYNEAQDLTASPKGIRADGDITISGGNVNVAVMGKSDGSEGIESKATVNITGGVVYDYAYDDALNAATAINVSGGRTYCYSVNNDGVDSNGSLSVSGGLLIGVGTNAPEGGIDVDNSNNFRINGGTVISLGGTLQSNPSTQSSQRSVVCSNFAATKGYVVSLLSSSSEPLLSFAVPRTMSGASLLMSGSEIASGSTYTLSYKGTLTGYTDSWNGYYAGGAWTGGTEIGSFTANSTVSTIGGGNQQGGGMTGGNGGGRPGGGRM